MRSNFTGASSKYSELLSEVKKAFTDAYSNDTECKRLQAIVDDGKATYKDAGDLAQRIGDLLSRIYRDKLQDAYDSAVLPYLGLTEAERDAILNETLHDEYKKIATVAHDTQAGINSAAGLHIQPVTPQANEDKIAGIVKHTADTAAEHGSAAAMDDLHTATTNYSRSVVDDSVKANASRQYNMGLHPKIIRRAEAGACKWCRDLAGEYDYPNVPQDVYRRHENCECTVTYYPGKGGGYAEDVWTKRKV